MQNDIRSLVEDFTFQLQLTIRRMALEQAQAALSGGAAPARRGPGRPAKTVGAAPARGAATGGKRDAASLDEMGAAILAFVQANPGLGAIEIAEAVKTDVGTIRLPMQKLLADRKVGTRGQRRGTKYFAGGGAGPAKPKTARTSKKTGKRGAKRAKAAGPKVETAVAAAA